MSDLKSELSKQEQIALNDSKSESVDLRQPRKQLTAKQKTCGMIIVAVLVFVLFLFLIGLIVLGVQVSKLKREMKEMVDSAPCTTVNCIDTVSELMRSVDPSVDPCEDFHKYACGKWEKHNPIPAGDEAWAPLYKLRVQNEKTVQRLIKHTNTRIRYSQHKALRKVFLYYDACMDEISLRDVGSKPLLQLIQDIGSFPIFDPNWNETEWEIVDVTSRIHRDYPANILFNLWTSVWDKNTSLNAISVAPHGTGLKQTRYNSTTSENMKIKAAYKKYIPSMLQMLGISQNKSVEMMESVFSVEFDIASLMSTKRVDPKTMTIKDMDKGGQPGMFNWTVFFQKLFRNSTYKPSDDTLLSVYDLEYFTKLKEYLATKPKRDIAIYVIWNVIHRYTPLLAKRFQAPYKEYARVFNPDGKIGPETPRWEKCVNEVKTYFGLAIGRIFVDEVFRNGSRREAIELVQSIKKVFIEDFDEVDWMDEKTKIVAKEKANVMHANVGYPDIIMDDKKLADQYKNINPANNTYFKNALSVQVVESQGQLESIKDPMNRKAWVIYPTTINAVYALQSNSMDIPAGILQKPLFHNTFPGSVNFGAIGAIIGHEMTHGFDTTGKQFNHQGHDQKWWSNSSLANFDKKASCFIDQYSNFTYRGMRLNGKNVIGEVIADNGGTEIAFKAYKRWVKNHGKEPQLPGVKLSHEQIFFIAYGQIFCAAYTKYGARMLMDRYHPINPLRVQGVAMNSKEFAKAYKCPVGSPMNPAKKCKIW